jgi:PEP-CTERM motif-containing protein
VNVERNRVVGALAAVLVVAGMASRAEAGVITNVNVFSLPGFSTGTLGPVGATPAPNNDNASTASPNLIPYSIFLNSVGLLEAEFIVSNSGGTTEYRFPQSFINNTGQAWSSFLFELGFGTGANFVRSGPSDGLDFDDPDADPFPTASQFSAVARQSDVLGWSGGNVPSVGVVAFAFAVDVPDNLASANPYGVSRFTLRQTPNATVPEPSSLLLIGSGLAGCLANRRRRA